MFSITPLFAMMRAVRNRTLPVTLAPWLGAHLIIGLGLSLTLAVPPAAADTTPQLQTTGGWIELDVQPEDKRVQGRMILFGAHSDSGTVFATLPPGTTGPVRVALQCLEVNAFQRGERLTIPLGRCPAQGCALELRWNMDTTSWSATPNVSRLDASGYRLVAADVLPRLAAMPDAHPMSVPALNQATDAPADWEWVIRIADQGDQITRRGHSNTMAGFRDAWTPAAPSRAPEAKLAATDPRSLEPTKGLRFIKASSCREC